MRISDWSSDVCSSDLVAAAVVGVLRFAQRLGCARQDVVAQGLRFVERSAKFAMQLIQGGLGLDLGDAPPGIDEFAVGFRLFEVSPRPAAEIGHAASGERACQYV